MLGNGRHDRLADMAAMKRSPIRRSRSKPRPGRVKGKDMQALREASWNAAHGLCCFCGEPVAFDRMELAHLRGKRMHGDSIENTGPAHPKCHHASHNPKACPAKIKFSQADKPDVA